MHQSAILI